MAYLGFQKGTHFPLPLTSLSHPLPSSPFLSLPFSSPPKPSNSWGRCKLPSRQRFWCILDQKGSVWSRKKPWWAVGNQSRRWWKYGISVSSSTGSWQWRLTWATLYVAAYQLCQLRSVKRSLTLDSRRALATAFVASRIDYCNGVLYGVAKGKVQRKEKFSDFKWFWTLLRDSSLVGGYSASSPVSSVMSSTGSLYNTESAKKSPCNVM